jgi:hypothetical protein
VSPALFGLVADQIAYGAAFALFGFCSLATAALLGFSVKETVGGEIAVLETASQRQIEQS